MKELMSDPDNKKRAKELSQYVSKLPREIQRLSDTDSHRYLIHIDEKNYLRNARTYLKNLYNCQIEIVTADEAELYDPVNKRKFAIPLRPAIYIE
jgi:leucyl-tRNA synthetase